MTEKSCHASAFLLGVVVALGTDQASAANRLIGNKWAANRSCVLIYIAKPGTKRKARQSRQLRFILRA